MIEVSNRSWHLNAYHSKRAGFVEDLGGLCAHCGGSDNLEFDHIEPELKSFNIGARLRGYPVEEIKEELKKCQLLCRSCHQKKSKKEGDLARGWTNKSRLVHGSAWTYKHHKCRCTICVAAHGPKRTARKHGERRTYLKGCKCALCKKANTAYTRELMARKKDF